MLQLRTATEAPTEHLTAGLLGAANSSGAGDGLRRLLLIMTLFNLLTQAELVPGHVGPYHTVGCLAAK
jgi:hypothetical protein